MKICWAWMVNRREFPKPCDFCGEPIHAQHAYGVYEFPALHAITAVPVEQVEQLRCERCLCKMDPAPLVIVWGLSVNTWTSAGEKDAWEAIGQDDPTLEACYARAQKQTGNFNIVKWYIQPGLGQHGTPVFKGWADRLPPIEELRAKSDGTWIPPVVESKPCCDCGEQTLIVCRTCGRPVCWNHGPFGRLKHPCDSEHTF